jgi:glutathione reductase (NADPH)
MTAGYDFDLITIGAGSGGVAASRRAAAYGPRVAICEGSRVGGTCVIRGCVPKKLFTYAAQFRDAFEDAAGFGWTVEPPRFDWPTLVANKDREIDRLNQVYTNLLAGSGVTLIPHQATLLDPHTVLAGGRIYTTETILIAAGSAPAKPPVPGIEHAVSSDEMFALPELPARLLVIGGGYIAVEFAGILNALGVKVEIVIRRDHILNGFDDDLRRALETELVRRGIAIHSRVQPAAVEPGAGGLALLAADGRRFEADLILAATGRLPRSRGLGLEAAGVLFDPAGAIKVDADSRTSVANIYAVGDVTDRVNLTPVAIAEGRAFAETFYNHNPTRVHYANIPSAVFSTPPLGCVGLTEAQARSEGYELDIYRSSFRPMKNTLSGREERTTLKLVVDRASDRVLGAHMLGPDAPEIVQGLAIAMNCGATKRDFDRTIGLHPSAAEEFVTLRDKVS